MNLVGARVVLRDRGTPDVLDLALRFVVHHRAAYAWTSLATLAPGLVITWAVGATAGWWLGWLVAIGLSSTLEAAFTLLASRLVFEPEARVRAVLASVAASSPRLFAARLLQMLAIGVGAMFFFVPGLLLGGFFFFLSEVTLLERTPFGAAISRLQRLVSGASGEAMVGLLLLLALRITAVLVGDVTGRAVVSDLLTFHAPPPVWEEGGSFFGALGFWAFVPFAATSRFFLYLNVRTRAEGWDVQTRFAALARRAAEADSDATTQRAA